MMDSVNIGVASQGFIIALFPIYNSMKKSAKPGVLWSILGGLTFTMLTYTFIALVSLAYFGTSQVQPSIFDNLKEDRSVTSLLLQAIFLLIFFCNIPFVFFAGKSSLVCIVQ